MRLTFKHVTRAATVVVVVWIIIRAALVWGTLKTYGVNPWVFLALDVFTAPPYVWGVGKMVQGLRGVSSLKTVYMGGTVAVLSFVAPYAYLFVVGHQAMPMSTRIIVVAIVVVIFVAGPFRELVRKARIGKACDE